MDSPLQGLTYWGISNVKYTNKNLDNFYEAAMGRAIQLFRECAIPVTFFCIGKELQESESARALVRKAYSEGHEIANHTYSHPFGITRLDQETMRKEIMLCSKIINEVIGVNPVGFRAPGYDVSAQLVNELESLAFHYDSSAFWTILNFLVPLYHSLFCKGGKIHNGFGKSSPRMPHIPYFPSREDCFIPASLRNIVEIPVPRTKILNLPFYNNFHLFTNSLYRKAALVNFKRPYFIYLFHLIEFVDLDDDVPAELLPHPNLKMPRQKKINIMRKSIEVIKNTYKTIRTDKFVENFKNNLCNKNVQFRKRFVNIEG